MLVLILVELSDVIFAVDSIPAIFAVTTDPFIVLTSNLFAILGLRAMYFLLAGVAERFSMLKYGLSVILVFIGIKMLIVDFYHIPIAISLGVVFGILFVTLIVNAWVNHQHDKSSKYSKFHLLAEKPDSTLRASGFVYHVKIMLTQSYKI